jgi:hypothetical protein
MTTDSASRRKMLTLAAAAGAAVPVALALSSSAKAAQATKYLILACDGGGMRGNPSRAVSRRPRSTASIKKALRAPESC